MTASSDLPLRFRKPRLRTDEAAEYLEAAHGLRVAPATLSKWRSTRPDGPPFQKFGASALYPRAELDAWAAAAVTTPRAKEARRC